jgi:hypothetical protein
MYGQITIVPAHFRPDRLMSRLETIVDTGRAGRVRSKRTWTACKGWRRFIAERPAIVIRHFQERFGFTECRAV